MKQRDTILDVTGMSCGGCVRHVTSALQAVRGVSKVDVQLRSGTVAVRHDPETPVDELIEAVRGAGYGSGLRA